MIEHQHPDEQHQRRADRDGAPIGLEAPGTAEPRPGAAEERRKQPDKGAKRDGEKLAHYREARHKRKQRRQPHKHSQTGRQAEGRTAYPAFRQDAPGDKEAGYYVN